MPVASPGGGSGLHLLRGKGFEGGSLAVFGVGNGAVQPSGRALLLVPQAAEVGPLPWDTETWFLSQVSPN